MREAEECVGYLDGKMPQKPVAAPVFAGGGGWLFWYPLCQGCAKEDGRAGLGRPRSAWRDWVDEGLVSAP